MLSRSPGGFPLWISPGISKNAEVFNSGKLPHFFCPERNRKVFHKQNDFVPKSPAFPQNTAHFAKSETVFLSTNSLPTPICGRKNPAEFSTISTENAVEDVDKSFKMLFSVETGPCCRAWAGHDFSGVSPPLPGNEKRALGPLLKINILWAGGWLILSVDSAVCSLLHDLPYGPSICRGPFVRDIFPLRGKSGSQGEIIPVRTLTKLSAPRTPSLTPRIDESINGVVERSRTQ